MPNPIIAGQFTQKDFDRLGLTPDELATTYQPSGGGTFHARGTENTGKSLWIAHFYRHLIDKCGYSPFEATGNMTFKGVYGIGYTVRKGEVLHQYLWDLTHIPLRHKIVIIDEIDSEFPARFFPSREQTQIALRMWHTAKLHNYILYASHLGHGADLIFDLATHFEIIPQEIDWQFGTMDFTVINGLDREVSDWTAYDILRTMLIYNRQEITENTEEDSRQERPKKATSKYTETEKEQTFDSLNLDGEELPDLLPPY